MDSFSINLIHISRRNLNWAIVPIGLLNGHDCEGFSPLLINVGNPYCENSTISKQVGLGCISKVTEYNKPGSKPAGNRFFVVTAS